MAANMSTDRRGYCMLCPSRVDPGHYTCHRCARRLWQDVADELIADALQEAPCTSPKP